MKTLQLDCNEAAVVICALRDYLREAEKDAAVLFNGYPTTCRDRLDAMRSCHELLSRLKRDTGRRTASRS
jgi:hypothetical protein